MATRAPDTVSRAYVWQDDAACLGVNPELFFSEASARSESADPATPRDRRQVKFDTQRAVGICNGCSVRRDCLMEAIERHEPYGVWGGMVMEKYWRGRQGPGAGGRPPSPCGTQAAWERHRKRHQRVDDECARAHKEYLAKQRQIAREALHEAIVRGVMV